MPAKTGASHAIASFGSIVLGAYISAHTSLVTGISRSIGDSVLSTVGLSLPESVTGMLLISTALAFLWGIAYHFARHSSEAASASAAADLSTPPQPDAVDVPEPLRDVVSEPYSSPDSIASVDAEVRSHLATELAAAGSVLDDVHDRLVESGDRDAAARVGSLAETVRQAEQRITSPQDGISTDAVSLRDRSAVVSIHTDLVAAIDRLHEELDALEQSLPNPAGEHFETVHRRLRDLETALERRQQRLDQGDNPR